MQISRVWAMPSHETFGIAPIGAFVQKYLRASSISVDPFARNCRWATHTNDLNPETTAQHHMDAEDFLNLLVDLGVRADLVVFDPPYSYRQVVECYQSVGREFTKKDQQQVQRWSILRDLLAKILTPGGVVLSFGWSSTGMGKKRGYAIEEILLVNHGSAHNDTICIAERCNS
jgi:hypothetical protein